MLEFLHMAQINTNPLPKIEPPRSLLLPDARSINRNQKYATEDVGTRAINEEHSAGREWGDEEINWEVGWYGEGDEWGVGGSGVQDEIDGEGDGDERRWDGEIEREGIGKR